MTEGVVHREIVSVLVMYGDSFFVEELEVFSESSDVFYGTFIFTVVPDRHSEVTHDSFSFFFFQSIMTELF